MSASTLAQIGLGLDSGLGFLFWLDCWKCPAMGHSMNLFDLPFKHIRARIIRSLTNGFKLGLDLELIREASFNIITKLFPSS